MASAAPWRPGRVLGERAANHKYLSRSLTHSLRAAYRPSFRAAGDTPLKHFQPDSVHIPHIQRRLVRASAAAAAGVYQETWSSLARRRLQHVFVSPLDKEIWAVALPALVAMLVEPLMNALNAGLVGHLGTQQLSAVSLGNLAVSLCTFFYTFLLFLTVPEIAAAVVKKDDDAVSCIAAKSLWLAGFCGVASSAAMFWGAGAIISFLNPPEATVAAYAVDYIRVRSLGIPAVLLGFVATGVFRGFKDTRTPMLGALVSAGASLGLNVLFLYVLQMGVTGAAAATTAAQVVSCTLLLTALLRGGRIQPRHLARPPPADIMLPTIKLGAVLGARNMVTFGMVIYASALSIRIGSTNQASFEIIRQFWILTIQFFECLNVAAQALCASYIGKEDRLTARALLNRLGVLGVAIGAVAGGAVWALHEPLVHFFTRDPLVVAQVLATLPMICCFFPLDAAASIMDGSLLAAKQSNYMSGVQIAGSVVQYFVLSYLATGGHVSTLTVWSALKILVVTRVITGIARNYFSPKSAYAVSAAGAPAAGLDIAKTSSPAVAAAATHAAEPASEPAHAAEAAAAREPGSPAAMPLLGQPAGLVAAGLQSSPPGAAAAAGPQDRPGLPAALQSIEDDVMVLACAACTSATDMNADLLSLKRRQQQQQQQQQQPGQGNGHAAEPNAESLAAAVAAAAATGRDGNVKLELEVASTSGLGRRVEADGAAGIGAFAGAGASPGGLRVVKVRVALGDDASGAASNGWGEHGRGGGGEADAVGSGSEAESRPGSPVLVQVGAAGTQGALAPGAGSGPGPGAGPHGQLPSGGPLR